MFTVGAMNDWLLRLVSGATEVMKKCDLGNGTMFVASFLKSAFNCPGNLKQVVTPLMVLDTRWLRSP